jgi:hypothetical protein
MAGCPNCGRKTLRTKDWVCQWCGYPLLYGNFKPIDKTFKELQEERSSSYTPEEQDSEQEYETQRASAPEPEPEPEPQPKPEPLWKQKRPPKPAYTPKPQPEPEPAYDPEPGIRPESAPRPAYQPPPRPVAQPRPQPPELAPQPKQEFLPGSQPAPVLLPESEPVPQPAPRPEAPLRPEPVPQAPSQPVARTRPEPPPPPPQPEPVTVPSLASITNGTQLTIDQIDALLRADSVGTSAAFKDKTLIIKGIVNKVFIRDHIDVRYLILTGARKVVWSARCSFEKESVADMSHLSEGQAVALRGKYDSYGKNIIFKDCKLVASN